MALSGTPAEAQRGFNVELREVPRAISFRQTPAALRSDSGRWKSVVLIAEVDGSRTHRPGAERRRIYVKKDRGAVCAGHAWVEKFAATR